MAVITFIKNEKADKIYTKIKITTHKQTDNL